MEPSGGPISAKLAKPADGGEDRLSALPDDVLVLILQCLDTTAEAARTSVLARRWRSLWALLPKVRFHLHPDGNHIRELLDVPDASELSYISVTTNDDDIDSATAWLPAAARRLAGGLFYRNMAPEDQFRCGGIVQLPCLKNATTIELDLRFLVLVFPSMGVFNRLTNLSLKSVEFHDPWNLGNAVSRTQCPCLQKLSICYIAGVGHLSINSMSLLQMELKGCDLLRLTIDTPFLEKLSVDESFPFGDDPSELVANIKAPQILSLVWKDFYDPQYFHLGNLGQLQELKTRHFFVYGARRKYNRDCLMLLQQFQVLRSLHLPLSYQKGMRYCKYLLGDITLPHIMFLHLDLCNDGHAFGASLFHLLGMCNGLRRLLLVLSTGNSFGLKEEPASCPSDCICDQPKNWKTDELVLDRLEDVHIIGLQGAEHEVAFVQRLLSWATVLKSLRITLDNEMTEGKIGELREALAGFSRPETCVQFDTSDE